MKRTISIDPGDKHCGVAIWHDTELIEAKTIAPRETLELLEQDQPDLLIVEEFRLYPWMAHNQGFSDLKTPQLIGALKYLAHAHNIDLVMQPAGIKKQAFAGMTASEFVMPKRINQHAKDAIAHGWWRLVRYDTEAKPH